MYLTRTKIFEVCCWSWVALGKMFNLPLHIAYAIIATTNSLQFNVFNLVGFGPSQQLHSCHVMGGLSCLCIIHKEPRRPSPHGRFLQILPFPTWTTCVVLWPMWGRAKTFHISHVGKASGAPCGMSTSASHLQIWELQGFRPSGSHGHGLPLATFLQVYV